MQEIKRDALQITPEPQKQKTSGEHSLILMPSQNNITATGQLQHAWRGTNRKSRNPKQIADVGQSPVCCMARGRIHCVDAVERADREPGASTATLCAFLHL
jgi:hypothetical protein